METYVTNRGCVDEWHELLNIVDEHSVEKVDIAGLEGGEIEILVDWRRSCVNHFHGTLDLRIHILHDMWNEAGEVLLYSLFRGK